MIAFTVPGEPRGKGRPRFVRATGRTYTDKDTEAYESLVRLSAKTAMGARKPADGPVTVSVMAYMPVPTSWPKWRKEAAHAGAVKPAGKPDGDNILKAVLDALNSVAYADDALVCLMTVGKVYSDTPRLEVVVTESVGLAGSRGTKADLEKGEAA